MMRYEQDRKRVLDECIGLIQGDRKKLEDKLAISVGRMLLEMEALERGGYMAPAMSDEEVSQVISQRMGMLPWEAQPAVIGRYQHGAWKDRQFAALLRGAVYAMMWWIDAAVEAGRMEQR